MTGSPPTFVVGPTGKTLRRRLGPTAWVVLEAAVALAHDVDGDLVVDTSARSLASEVGLSKNTVARALSTFRESGFVTSTQTRAGDGVFGAGRYGSRFPQTSSRSPRRRRSSRYASRPTNRVTRSSVDRLALHPD